MFSVIHNAPNINHLWSRLLIEELRRNGVDTFYISPGSRSTPLTVAAAQTEGVHTHVHFDERGAAFAALGHAMGSERPTALICTSGTAAANYLPAIVEASQSGIPLIVLTADRPPELTDAGANQAINQIGLYRNFTRWEHALPCPTLDMPAPALLTTIDQACYRAQSNDSGPVHINCAFREPLAPTDTGGNWTEYLLPIERWLGSDAPLTTYAETTPALNKADAARLETILSNTQRGLLVIGRLTRQADRDAAAKIATMLHWPVFADITAGLFPLTEDTPSIPYYDLMLASQRYSDACNPDTVIHLGDALVSKRLQQHLESTRPEHYVHIAGSPRRKDAAHIDSLRINAPITELLHAFPKELPASNKAWRSLHLDAMGAAMDQLLQRFDYVLGTPLTEPSILNMIIASQSADDALFIGNSMPVRDANTFALHKEPLTIASNRGASGIDGNIATAVGFARGLDKSVTAIVGDVTALHDLNSLALLGDCDPPVALIVINNDGGGVFHFLPIADQDDVFETYFGTPHGLTFEHAATMFGIDYHAPTEMPDLLQRYTKARTGLKSCIIEVKTDRRENHRLHQEIIEVVRCTLDNDAE